MRLLVYFGVPRFEVDRLGVLVSIQGMWSGDLAEIHAYATMISMNDDTCPKFECISISAEHSCCKNSAQFQYYRQQALVTKSPREQGV